ncbi:MAG: Major Facilitator Superfamily, partial [Verrucomicrobiales bacterium]|nr:Major Facilitator Superfamily [Verrucomicrobiales bacterium]
MSAVLEARQSSRQPVALLSRKLKRQVFLLEWLNIYAIAYYFDFLFFFMRDQYGFSNRDNLVLAAVNGFLYVMASWLGGKFAQKHGYFLALKVGFTTVAVCLGVGLFLSSVGAQVIVLVIWTFGTCFTWPSLEALVSENEDRPGLMRMIGIYNLTWASGAALAYFTGGALLQKFGPKSLFLLPAVLHCLQLLISLRLESAAQRLRPLPEAG